MVVQVVAAGSMKLISAFEDLRALSEPVINLKISGRDSSRELHALLARPEGLTGLQTLYLEECSGLTGLPESLGGLTGLQTLDLIRCLQLTGLPESLGGLTRLQSLRLEGCSGLTRLPESLGGLTGLQTLDL
jgi:Leucine-rich repeat (LRR) protein